MVQYLGNNMKLNMLNKRHHIDRCIRVQEVCLEIVSALPKNLIHTNETIDIQTSKNICH